MTSATFIDTNVPIYAAGAPHPLKFPCSEVLRLAAEHPYEFVTDAEVLRELLHRYVAIKRWTQGREVLKRFTELMLGRIEPVQEADVTRAAQTVGADDAGGGLSARDLLHAAIMHRLGVGVIISSDAGFDGLPAVERLDPADMSRWRDRYPVAG